MPSSFVSAGELLGPELELRVTTIAGSPNLPDGEYAFVDSYCTDRTCDCRKTMIQVFYDDKIVSVINFGWERPKFYIKWMGQDLNAELKECAKEMSGLSIDITSPDLVSRQGILSLVKILMDKKWIAKLKKHYRLVRELEEPAEPSNIIRLLPKLSRNAPCSCGSGKKYKHCCL